MKRYFPGSDSPIVKSRSSDLIFDIFIYIAICTILLVILYPLYLVLIASVSEPAMVMHGEVLFYPKGFLLEGYQSILEYKQFWISYRNTVIYTVVGTAISIFITMMAAYATTCRFIGKGIINFFIIFTMFFHGGLIPTFLTMRDIGLYDNVAIMVLMGTVSIWNMMIARTYINCTIPKELYEAAVIDGTSHFSYFLKVVMPLSGTIIAVLCVYYGVARWNDYFTGLVYLRNRNYLPLQTILREILASLKVTNDFVAVSSEDIDNAAEALRKAEVAKYCVIVVSTVPAVILYLFMQKYFVKGVMIGSLKG